jgi:archaeal type IV pilus assembly protein PilA
MKKTLWHSKKGISTIIATIIIVSVSIVMAIAVAFWAMGIGNSFTKFEKVEFTSVYADYNPAVGPISYIDSNNNTITIPGVPANYTVSIVLKNSGSAAATISNIFLNGRPYDSGYLSPITNVTQTGLLDTYLPAGKTTADYAPAKIFLPAGTGDWSHGNSVDVQILTAAGRSYSSTVVLP